MSKTRKRVIVSQARIAPHQTVLKRSKQRNDMEHDGTTIVDEDVLAYQIGWIPHTLQVLLRLSERHNSTRVQAALQVALTVADQTMESVRRSRFSENTADQAPDVSDHGK